MKIKSLAVLILFLFFAPKSGVAQTDVYISGASVGFPIAVPQLCDAGNGNPENKGISDVLSSNLALSGVFNVLEASTFIEEPGSCRSADETVYSDWSVIGAEGLVKGRISSTDGENVVVDMYLFDVQQQKPVLGKRYQSARADYRRVAHRFANEVMRYFTGIPGVFGSQIAFVSKVGRFKELFLMELDGSELRQLTSDRGIVVSPSWSDSGDRIIYTSYRSRRPDLYYLPMTGGSPVRVTQTDGLELGPKFVSGGNSILASASVDGITNILLFDLKGQIQRRLTRGPSIDVSPSISPDGQSITFCSNRGGGPQIYVMNADGSNPRRISFVDSNYCTSPSWSPKGDKIAYVCRMKGHQIFLSDPDGQNTTQLTFSGLNEDPEWAPDGRSLVFSSNMGRGGPRNVVIYSLLSHSARRISFSKSEDSMPAWSPVFD